MFIPPIIFAGRSMFTAVFRNFGIKKDQSTFCRIKLTMLHPVDWSALRRRSFTSYIRRFYTVRL
jgi:hypothetical protein